ncbi:MAG: hypothetical protein QXP01_00790, partial [Candidatus Hadarchaeum sp.]
SLPIVGGDGTIYVGGVYGIYAFAPDGNEKWSTEECTASGDDSATAGGSLALDSAGVLYTAGSHKLCAFGESAAQSTATQDRVILKQTASRSAQFLAPEAAALRVELFNLASKRVYDSVFITGNSFRWG